jgi:hypothetical protein
VNQVALRAVFEERQRRMAAERAAEQLRQAHSLNNYIHSLTHF